MSTDSTEGQPERDDAPGLAALDGDKKEDVEGHMQSFPSNADEKGTDAPGMKTRLDGDDDDVEGHATKI